MAETDRGRLFDTPDFYLPREDPVLQAVSLAKAVRTSVFHSVATSPERLARAEAGFAYDGDEIARRLNHVLDQERRCEGFFARQGLAPIRLSYEEITAAGEVATPRPIHGPLLPGTDGLEQPAPGRGKPVLYLHIGAHKTATTTIQGSFRRERDLLARHGLLYPMSNCYHFAQHRLAFALKGQRDPARGDRPKLAAEVTELRAAMEAQPLRHTFVSSEGFFATPERRLRELRAALDFAEVRVIAMVRRQDSYLLSLYNQHVMQLGNRFTLPLREHVANPRGIAREISFLPWLKGWQEIFGQDAVRLLRYEDDDPLRAILDTLGLPGTLVTAPGRANVSAPAAATEVVRLAKRLRLPRWLQAVVAKASIQLFAGGPKPQLTETDRRRILEEFAADNEAMFAAFGMENTYAP